MHLLEIVAIRLAHIVGLLLVVIGVTGVMAEPPLVGEWTAAEWAVARQLSPLLPPPPDPTNALGQSTAAARLGHHLFFDPRLSPHNVACATCHKPDLGFADGRPTANTLGRLHRHTMTILNVGHYRWLTWDGSSDSLWHQALGPIESDKEMGSSRLYVIQAVMRHYGPELASVVALPRNWDSVWPTLPADGKPGDVLFDQLPTAYQKDVNQVFAMILKCIAAYERRLGSTTAPFDRYIEGDRTALSRDAQRGFQQFVRLQCPVCHTTPLLSDDEFHNLGLPSDGGVDRGRATGLPRLHQSRFRGTGPYADGKPVVRAEDYQVGKALVGSFRTPTLRELKTTAPYGHNGSIATLEAWLDHYVQVTKTPQTVAVGVLDPVLGSVQVTLQERSDLVAFLLSLSSDYASEWAQAPPEIAK